MSDNKFQNKYRIPSARLKKWDYANNGAYFITICTKDMNHYFGRIQNQTMNLNECGILAERFWIEIQQHFSFIELGNFQIMPNHMHGILIINKFEQIVNVPIISENIENGGFAKEMNPMLNENISRVIRWYKGRCTFEMRKKNKYFEWHTRFYDHIIRNSEDFERIQNYIVENPIKWNEDKFYS